MSTTPAVDPLQPPPGMTGAVNQQDYTAHSGHGSVGPVIAVLAVISILSAVAVMIGRLCSGRRIMGHGQYDFESWVETKCASCLDGHVGHPPPLPPPPENTVDAVPAAAPQEGPRGAPEEEVSGGSQRNPHERAES
ncbi:hypothetical protein RJ639_043735 [Escallonia herrerae]|uniref:Uncharacterized protein n=1 Tax=Escallonia herrerae TaxID=1293975 RepID=A0AA88WD31_9ASTE|nr:hypothetical protein RJ639_043735 [Escallonia herrerae]